MANTLTPLGRAGFLGGTIDFDTDTIKVALLDLDTTDVAVKAITAASNATPIVITSNSHGFANGDYVVVGKVAGNLAANGVWLVASVATNTFALTDPVTGGNAVGSAAYTSGGYAANLGPGTSGDNWDDFDGCLVGTATTLASPTVTNGIADAADTAFGAVTGASVEALALYKDTGTASTSKVIALIDGRHIVTCAAQAAASATTVAVERLSAGIPNSTVLTFSNGATATLSALANAGDRTITVSALAAIITAGSRADAPATSSPFPYTPNGATVTMQWPNSGPWGAASGIFQV